MTDLNKKIIDEYHYLHTCNLLLIGSQRIGQFFLHLHNYINVYCVEI